MNILKSGYYNREVNDAMISLDKFFLDFQYTVDYKVVEAKNILRKSIISKFTHKQKQTNIVTPVVDITECD